MCVGCLIPLSGLYLKMSKCREVTVLQYRITRSLMTESDLHDSYTKPVIESGLLRFKWANEY